MKEQVWERRVSDLIADLINQSKKTEGSFLKAIGAVQTMPPTEGPRMPTDKPNKQNKQERLSE